jgi:hypothetical protein
MLFKAEKIFLKFFLPKTSNGVNIFVEELEG